MSYQATPDERGDAAGEHVQPTYFRSFPRQLYACHHAPASVAGKSAALLLNPVGHEYERCHRAMRQLALLLSRSGRHAMRFDYYGTGDSSGDCSDASLATWRGDVADAIDECRRLSACDRVTLVGLRLGGTLAAQVAAARADVDRLVIFAPVLDASTLFDEWADAQRAFYRSLGREDELGTESEVLGFPLAQQLADELRGGLGIAEPTDALRAALVLVPAGGAEAVHPVAARLRGRGANVTVETEGVAEIWRRQPMEAIVPFKLLRRIVAWLNETET